MTWHKLKDVYIKIYPEWNVNSLLSKVLLIVFPIKIYPEWNVNYEAPLAIHEGIDIKIYPEWNVNVKPLTDIIKVIKLKSIQSGM